MKNRKSILIMMLPLFLFLIHGCNDSGENAPNHLGDDIFEEEGKLTLYSLNVPRGEGNVITFGSTIDLDGTAFITDGSEMEWEVFFYKDWHAVADGTPSFYARIEEKVSSNIITYEPSGSGYYLFKLVDIALGRVVADGTLVVFNNGNEAPSALFDMDKISAELGDDIHLDGTGSSDPDGDALSFEWSYYKVEPADYRWIEDETIPYTDIDVSGDNPDFTPVEPGLYYLKLEVSDNDIDNSRDNSTAKKISSIYVREAGAIEGRVQSEYEFLDNGDGTYSAKIDFSDFLWYEILSNDDFGDLNIFLYFERDDFSVIVCHYFTSQTDDLDLGSIDYPAERLSIDRVDLRNIQIDNFTEEQKDEFYNIALRVFYSENGDNWHSYSNFNVAEEKE